MSCQDEVWNRTDVVLIPVEFFWTKDILCVLCLFILLYLLSSSFLQAITINDCSLQLGDTETANYSCAIGYSHYRLKQWLKVKWVSHTRYISFKALSAEDVSGSPWLTLCHFEVYFPSQIKYPVIGWVSLFMYRPQWELNLLKRENSWPLCH